ncbi:hypothetical protein C0989_002409 [Termitomyces sp. Mn162]|nr:hypothetical protein C0989_002409 [Termitomyces sp. Mn162]
MSSEGIAQALTTFLSVVEETTETPSLSGDLSSLETLLRDSVAYDPAYLVHLEVNNGEGPKHKKRAADEPLQVWLPYQELFLQELISSDGRGDKPKNECAHCIVFLAGLNTPKNRYESLVLMIRQWHYLKMLERRARRHEKNGLATTTPGSCTVECPACSHPEKYMPDNWKDTPENKKWLHSLFIGIDANFRLKWKDVSCENVDLDLGNGFSFFIPDKAYKEYLWKHKDDVEPKSNCSRHNAINLANTKFNQGLAATGVATIKSHVVACHSVYSFHYGLGVGRMDGEAPERGWAETSPLASSTKEMGPGLRRDVLDCHFGDYNWRKVTSMEPTQALVRYELAQAEARNASTTEETSLDEHVLPSVLIACGLEIEGEQCGLKVEASKIWQHSQDRQRSKIQLRCNSLQRKIAAWSQINQLYIPAVTTLSRIEEQTTAAQKKPLHAYTISHWLPSQIGTKLSFDLHLAEIEWKLRVAQAYEALETLRSCLQIR